MSRSTIWATTFFFVLGTAFSLAVGIIDKTLAVGGFLYPVGLALALTLRSYPRSSNKSATGR